MFSCVQRNRKSFLDDKETVHYHPAPDIGAPDLRQEADEERRGIAIVELYKAEGCTLGLTISGGVDKNCRPQVSNLRPGSIAHRCDALEVGDFILSVNGIRTSALKHEEIVNLLKNAGEQVILEVEYEVPESALQSAFSIQCKRHEIVLEKEGNSFGFTLRGGLSLERMKSHALTVTSVRAGGPADRDGHLKAGDRVIAINGFNVAHLSLSETMAMMQKCESRSAFLVEYDVSVMDAVQNATGPLLVEIEKVPGVSIGIGLSHVTHNNKRSISIETVAPMGIADRSGAIHVGDQILSIDGASVERMSLPEASQLLKSGSGDQVRLEIIPISHIQQRASREAIARKALVPICMPSSVSTPTLALPSSPFGTLHNYSTIRSSGSCGRSSGTLPSRISNQSNSHRSWSRPDRKQASCMSVASTVTSVMPNNQICHTEVVEVILYHDHRGPGITLSGGIFSTTVLTEPPVISYVEPGSAADRSGVIQEGDRIISINGQELVDKTFDEANTLLKESGTRCLLEIEFDVTESVLPSSGTFVVKLPRRSYGLGITVNAPNNRKPTDPLIITDVRRGSVANRCGSIQPSDKLLAINDIRMEPCCADEAANLLETADDIIVLKLRRDDPYGDEDSEDCVTYTVELQKRGGILGITISGTDNPMDPITISGLTEGGLAERTGAIHVGDKLLAINGNTTRGCNLSEAINMLQLAGDLVTLKISRTVEKTTTKKRFENGKRGYSQASPLRHQVTVEREDYSHKTATPIPSVDSALESWGSSGLESFNQNSNIHTVLVTKNGSSSINHSPDKSATLPADFRSYPDSIESSSEADGSMEGNSTHHHYTDDGWQDNESNQSYEDSSDNEKADEWSRTCDDLENTDTSEMLRQIGASLRQRSVASLHKIRSREGRRKPKKSNCHCAQGNDSNINTNCHNTSKVASSHTNTCTDLVPATFDEQVQTIFSPTPIELHKFTIVKENATEDFGFSLSEGMYEKGVYISAIRPGSLAEKSGLLQYDRILQVNNVKTRDFDCRLVVPVIAEAGSYLELVVSRNPLADASNEGRAYMLNNKKPLKSL
ncbi:glutamate receptor-interacting protein 1 isoform X10 [Octopus bimaculoides]|uniref:glutamate receptor-interacting protein 1 isoform X10 n=1 Tax=Octopus bimaculoides TaxID=37653 RepID=UPI00078A0253|nr:glutamate receptor-interacting protein 1 isoform X10 [Octopus bimaculoides]UVH70863.1 GRIP [Octopus bimaculoides]